MHRTADVVGRLLYWAHNTLQTAVRGPMCLCNNTISVVSQQCHKTKIQVPDSYFPVVSYPHQDWFFRWAFQMPTKIICVYCFAVATQKTFKTVLLLLTVGEYLIPGRLLHSDIFKKTQIVDDQFIVPIGHTVAATVPAIIRTYITAFFWGKNNSSSGRTWSFFRKYEKSDGHTLMSVHQIVLRIILRPSVGSIRLQQGPHHPQEQYGRPKFYYLPSKRGIKNALLRWPKNQFHL